ncbi:hypothetical protein GM418_00055 [Maribellus comscasis]|uniref:GTP-binding protein n=1 Tax=Maribellus comscasis TaxID=2681766 RepID=A0A6I6JPE1_9BACT|nr:GTP-binding protein [Maribellus comscasis]QGY42102.1 hypothetical protein GM418_00055 [Maribellus comscasis]
MSIPIHLVTGFLGSGKSSFIKHYLENSKNKGKIAIIQNEFSPVGIDGRNLLQTNDYEILEINNGSVFCVCLLGSFIDSLSSFIENIKPNILIMEASGLSDTIGVGQVFQAKKLKGKVYLDHVWCLVDAQNFNRFPLLHIYIQHQLRSADTIIVNKTDLVEDNAKSVISSVRQINPFAGILTAHFGKIDLTISKKALNLFPDTGEKPLGRPDIESVVIRSSLEIQKKNLEKFFDANKSNSIRCKGYIKLSNSNFAFIQGVFKNISIDEIPAFSGPTEFVMIGNFNKQKNLQIMFDEYCRK